MPPLEDALDETVCVLSLNLTGHAQPLLEVVTSGPMSRLDAWKRFAEVLKMVAVEQPKIVQLLKAQGFVLRDLTDEKPET